MNNETTVLTAAQVKVLADYPSVAEEYFTKPDMVTEGDAIELAYVFAQYKSTRVSDLNTVMDCTLAEGAARRLRRCQDEIGIHLVDTDKLEATERRMQRYAEVLKTQGSI